MRDWIKGIPAAMRLRLSCRVALLALVVVAAWGAIAGCEPTADEVQPAVTVETQEVSLPPTPVPETPAVTAPATPTLTISTPTPEPTDTPTPVMETPTPVAMATPTPVATPPPVPTPTPAPRGERQVPSAWQLETRSNPKLAAQYPLADLYTADEIAYFKEIAFEDDLRGVALFSPAATEEIYKEGVAYKKGVQKWGSGQVVKYAAWGGGASVRDVAEVDSVITRIDALIPVLDFRPAEEPSDASLVILVATYDEVQREMQLDTNVAIWRITPYVGFTPVENFVVTASVVIINADQPAEIRRRSIVKGLAASLGLAGNSWSYPDSIFYEDDSSPTELADIDEALIRLLYDPRIKPGMTIEDLERMGL